MSQCRSGRHTPALGDPRVPVDDRVIAHADLIRPWRLQGERDARVAQDVLDLAVAEQMPRDDLVVLDPNPNDRHLGTAVGIERDKVRERPRLDQLANRVEQRAHRRTSVEAMLRREWDASWLLQRPGVGPKSRRTRARRTPDKKHMQLVVDARVGDDPASASQSFQYLRTLN